jgi:hypothetical protein
MARAAGCSLIASDNDTFVVESFRDVQGGTVLPGETISDESEWGPALDDDKTVFETTINPHSYRVLEAQ